MKKIKIKWILAFFAVGFLCSTAHAQFGFRHTNVEIRDLIFLFGAAPGKSKDSLPGNGDCRRGGGQILDPTGDRTDAHKIEKSP